MTFNQEKRKKLSEIFNPNFHEFRRVSKENKFLYYVLKGGRSSAKSTHIAFDIILEMMSKPVTTLCIRRVANTLAESCFEQLKEAIEILGVESEWEEKKSPLQLIYKPRGNKIIFRGADDSNKIKSIKMAKFPIAIAWIEELGEFRTEDEVSTIINSIVRKELDDGLQYKIYYSYNPPKRKQSWVNKKFETHDLPSNIYMHSSTYLENPHISKAFIEEAEEVKKRNELKYRWEYLGEPIGSGVVPFTNLVFREITDDEVKRFDNIYQGLDEGYSIDPMAFIRLHYCKKTRTLYLIDEFYEVKASNRKFAEWIKSKGYNDTYITMDSSAPRSLDELRSYGLKMLGAKKGPGSVEYGEKWLDDLNAIVIDPRRTPKACWEFENIDYATDKDGNPLDRLVDKDNHIIDSCRYSCEPLMRSGKKLNRDKYGI